MAVRSCSRCVLPEGVPGAELDAAGVCSFCRDHESADHTAEEAARRRRERDLESALQDCRGRGEYDCVVTYAENGCSKASDAATLTVIPGECPGDIDGDGDTDHSDLGELLAVWCTHEGDPNWNPNADLDGDGHVGHGDLGIVLADWGCDTTP